MKLLYVTKNMPFGSAEAFIFEEIDNHLAAGWEVWIAPVGLGPLVHERGRRLLPRTLRTGLLSGRVIMGAACAFLRSPVRALCALAGLFDFSRPALIVRNLAVYPKGLWLSGEVRRLGVDHIHCHWIAVPATMAMIAARMSGAPMSITAHRYDIAQGNLVPAKFAASRFVRVIDGPGRDELAAQLPAGARLPVILRMGVEMVSEPVPIRPGGLAAPRALIGARLMPKKGHATLLRAVAAARGQGVSLHLDIYGDGPLEGELRRLTEELGLPDLVRFCGVASHEALLAHLRGGDYDMAILPSVTASDGDKEGIPVFLMEAMAAGLPVIATPNGGIAELITEGSGLLVPERDADALARAIATLAGDEELRRANAKAGRTCIAEEFSIGASAGRLRALIAGEGLA